MKKLVDILHIPSVAGLVIIAIVALMTHLGYYRLNRWFYIFLVVMEIYLIIKDVYKFIKAKKSRDDDMFN